MKKSSIIAIGLSTLLVVCNALPMNNHVENKKEVGISQKEASKKKSKKEDVSKDETDETDNVCFWTIQGRNNRRFYPSWGKLTVSDYRRYRSRKDNDL